ncbi:MAG: DNA repair protein RadC [Candidatus Roizmanbacteria bacterium]
MKIKDLPLHERPREKLIAKGPENLKDAELIAILLRTGVKGKSAIDIAQSVLNSHSLTELSRLTYVDLRQVGGLEQSKICTLLSAFELMNRALLQKDNSRVLIQQPKDILSHVYEIKEAKKENFVVIYLNARNELIQKEIISVGTLNASLVHPREVFEPAIRCVAGQIILAHNHPSGDPDPSDADIEITQRLTDAGKILGIDVVDHVIVTKEKYFSFKEKGLI